MFQLCRLAGGWVRLGGDEPPVVVQGPACWAGFHLAGGFYLLAKESSSLVITFYRFTEGPRELEKSLMEESRFLLSRQLHGVVVPIHPAGPVLGEQDAQVISEESSSPTSKLPSRNVLVYRCMKLTGNVYFPAGALGYLPAKQPDVQARLDKCNSQIQVENKFGTDDLRGWIRPRGNGHGGYGCLGQSLVPQHDCHVGRFNSRLLLAIDLPPSSAAAAVIPIRGLGRTVSTLSADSVDPNRAQSARRVIGQDRPATSGSAHMCQS
ncbi:hypothetical protein PGTUg99_028546 [Puccinia graminis f. sp. tritici]|uniref:Uncharacterized protein n=1 Tax=Puccinia graminis f. sp. tritici TaxID=56615 RepID=A0A5B0Q7X2_PUCGR|nr:hypothetical protein PGTUg99_028546 [Puccinia graminis f. sp. tritici]